MTPADMTAREGENIRTVTKKLDSAVIKKIKCWPLEVTRCAIQSFKGVV